MSVDSKSAAEQREQRLAARLARRHSDEWRASGQQLTEQREQQRAAAAAERAAAEQRHAVEFWQTQCDTVRASSISKHVAAFERQLAECAADQSVDAETIAHDVLCSYVMGEVLYGRASRARVALALCLLSTDVGDTAAALDTLRRLMSEQS